jgi:Coenzyme PQQ synthesis protein D (PqqD)
MATNDVTTPESILNAVVRVPETTVYRAFVAETVVLNLETGLYHGLNPTAGRMLELLDELGSVKETLDRLVKEYDAPRDQLEQDLAGFCQDLVSRKLVQIEQPS